MYVIVRGRLALEMNSNHQPHAYAAPIALSTLGPSQVAGLWAIIKPYFYAFSARAIDPLDCLAIDGEALRKYMEADPQLGYTLMMKVAEQLAIRLDQAREVVGHQRKLIGSPSYQALNFRNGVAYRSGGKQRFPA